MLRIFVQDKDTSNWVYVEFLLPAASLLVLVSVSVKQEAPLCAAALFGCYLHKQLPTSPSPSHKMAKLTISSHREAPRSIFQQLSQKNPSQ